MHLTLFHIQIVSSPLLIDFCYYVDAGLGTEVGDSRGRRERRVTGGREGGESG